MDRTDWSWPRLWLFMRTKFFPTTFAATLFLSVAVFEIGPQAAPQVSSTPAPKLAKYEPARGAYLGAAVDFSHLSKEFPASGEMANAMSAWEKQSARENAFYVGFHPFPHEDGSFPSWDSDPNGWASIRDFFEACDALDAAPLLTLEPQKPRVFVDDWNENSVAYQSTRALAQSIGKWNKPAFIRFAHEMNGNWYPWAEWIDKNRNQKRDPDEDTGFTAKDYRAAYRNVALMFRQYAPNVALVWCPNSGLLGGPRRDPFGPWYPGDDVVDWVGLDVYERGWTMPNPGAHLWGGQFAFNITRDMNDDASTPDKNESVNFYETYAEAKNKPLMLCETGATLSYRSDLSDADRELLNHQWKSGYWNPSEYGWMQQVLGTSSYPDTRLLQPIDRAFPKLKAVAWFQIAKREYIPAEKTVAGKTQIMWFDNSWADYRIGGGAREDESTPAYGADEMALYHRLTDTNYFLSKIQK